MDIDRNVDVQDDYVDDGQGASVEDSVDDGQDTNVEYGQHTNGLVAEQYCWHPVPLLYPPRKGPRPFALIILNQPLERNGVVEPLLRDASYIVAADGGANRLLHIGKTDRSLLKLNAIVGDLDSLTDEAGEYFMEHSVRIIHDPGQDSTDFEKAVEHVRDACPDDTDIVVLGGLGGRVDQGLSQLHYLYKFQDGQQEGEPYANGRMYLVSDENLTFLLAPGVHAIWLVEGGVEVLGRRVGIIPLKGNSVISTEGLQWEVTNWETAFGDRISTSNRVRPDENVVVVRTSNSVIFTISLSDDEA